MKPFAVIEADRQVRLVLEYWEWQSINGGLKTAMVHYASWDQLQKDFEDFVLSNQTTFLGIEFEKDNFGVQPNGEITGFRVSTLEDWFDREAIN